MANGQYTVEDIAKIRKGMEEGRQKRSEEIAKQTNAAPKYNTLPTLNDMSKRVPNQAPSSVSLGNKTLKVSDNARNTTISKNNGNAIRPTTKYSNQTAGQTKPKAERDTKFDKDFDNFYEWRYNRADTTDYDANTDTNVPHWESVKKDIMKKNNWSEADFDKKWKEYDKMRTQKMADEEVAKSVELTKKHPLLGAIAQQSYVPQTILEGAETYLDNTLGLAHPELKPTSSDDPRFTGTRVREATKQTIRDKADTKVGKGALDLVGSVADLGMNAAMSGGNPLLMGLYSGTQSATRNQMEALERGSDPTKAALYGAGAGAISGVMNGIGLDKALGATAKTVLGTIGKSAATEALENVVEDASNLGLDELINKDYSQLETLHDYYVGQGLDDGKAWAQVAKDTGIDLLKSAGSGALFGGLMSGAKNFPALKNEVKGDITNIKDKAKSLPELIKPSVNSEPTTSDWATANEYWTVGDKTFVGRATKVPSKYTGSDVLPTQSKQNTKRYVITQKDIKKAQSNIDTANVEGKNQNISPARALTKIYEKLFDNNHVTEYKTTVKNLTDNGKNYDVTVNKKAVNKIVHEGYDARKMAVLDNLKNVIEMSNYVGSGDVTNNNQSNIKRYDYFETPIEIDKNPYIVTYSVAVQDDMNKFRTHAVIDELKVRDLRQQDTAKVESAASTNNELLSQREVPSDLTVTPTGENVNPPEGTPRYMAEDIGLRGDEGGIEEEFPWETPEEPPRVEVNGEAPSEVQPDLLNKMDDRYRTNEYVMKNKSSKTVSNADRRIDTEYADELMEKGIDRYWSQSHKQQYSDAREAVSSDYDGNLNKYLNNDGSMYTGTDYNAIRILEEDIKAKRKGAIAEGNEELANKYTEQLEKLATTRRLRATSSGQFNEAAKAWISTAEGAIDTAINKVNDAIDNLPKNEAKFITEAADDIYDNANKMLEGEDLWNELERGEKKDKIASEIAKKIKDISKEKNIKVNDELASKIANDIINGADSDTIAREIAAFHEYGFLGIDDNVLDEVTDIFDRAEQLPYGSKERVELEQGAYSKLAREIYKNGGDKMDMWNAWRYFSMLSSPLTDIRNVHSTGTFSEIEHRTSNAIAYALEAGMDNAVKGLKEGSNFFFNTDYDTSKGIKRTKAFINPASEADQTLLKKSWDDATEGSYRWLVGHKFNPSLNSGIESEKPVFKPNSKADKTLGKVFKKRGDVLTGEDFFFKRNKFATSLAGYLKANGADASIFDNAKRFEELNNKMGLLTNEERAEMEALRPDFNLMSEARDYAVKEAQYSTYNTPNNAGKVSEASKRMLQSSNPITRFFGRWIEGLLAFKQTPANILRTMYDYSPLSVGSSAKKLVQAGASSDNTKVGKVLGKKVGESTWADAFSQLSKTLTGTGLVWLGAALYDNGIITPSSDNVTGKSDETEGKQEYSININGKSYKIDWLGPAVSSLLLGAEAKRTYDKYHDEDDTFWDVTNKVWNGGIDEILDTAMTIFDPAIEMSMLKGFSDTIDNVRYQDSKASGAMALLASPILSYYGQAVPQLLGGITRTADNTRRSLRTNNEGVGGIIERSARQVASKIPFLNQKNMEYVDMWGEGQKNYDGNLAQRAAYQFLAPSYVKELKSEPYQDELDRLYDVTGDAEVLNSSFPNKIDGERLTNDEYHDAQEIAGKTLQSFINATLESDEYKSLDPAVQADVQERLQKAANAVGTHLVRPEKKLTDDVYNAYGQDKNVQAALDEAIKGAKRTSINTAISDMGLQANDVTKALYQNNDTQGLEKYKDATNIGKEYGFDNITSTQWKVYKSKGEKALRKELEYAQEAGEYGVKNSKAFKELVDRGASGEQIKEAYDAITSVQVGKDEYGDPKYMPFTKENFELYRKYGERGIKDYAYIESKGADFDTYLQARKVIPDMSKQEFVKKFKAIDGSAGSKPDGDISQKELLRLFNSKNFNQSQVNKYWNAFGQVSGDDAWKKVPVLKYNKKTGKNEWKTQKK